MMYPFYELNTWIIYEYLYAFFLFFVIFSTLIYTSVLDVVDGSDRQSPQSPLFAIHVNITALKPN